MRTTLIEIANTAMDQYKEVLESMRNIRLEYEKKDRQIPVLRVGEYVVSMHASEGDHPHLIGVSVNLHDETFSHDSFAHRILDKYQKLDKMTVATFCATTKHFRYVPPLPEQHELLYEVFQQDTVTLYNQQQQGKAAILRMDFTLLPKGQRMLRTDRHAFTQVAYGYLLRTFFAEYVGFVQVRPQIHLVTAQRT